MTESRSCNFVIWRKKLRAGTWLASATWRLFWVPGLASHTSQNLFQLASWPCRGKLTTFFSLYFGYYFNFDLIPPIATLSGLFNNPWECHNHLWSLGRILNFNLGSIRFKLIEFDVPKSIDTNTSKNSSILCEYFTNMQIFELFFIFIGCISWFYTWRLFPPSWQGPHLESWFSWGKLS